MLQDLTFYRSSYSSPRGQECVECASATWTTSSSNCVQTADLPSATVTVRDSQHPQRGHLSFQRTEWGAFLAQMKGSAI